MDEDPTAFFKAALWGLFFVAPFWVFAWRLIEIMKGQL